MFAELTSDSGEITVNYAVTHGDGSPLILLHGFMGRWQDFLPILPTLAEHWKVFAPDTRGHGRSGRAPHGVYEHGNSVDDALSFLRDVVGAPAVLVGHSAGVPGAVEAAVREPELVRGVAVGDFPVDVPFLADIVRSEQSVMYHQVVRQLAGRPVGEILPAVGRMHPDSSGRECRAVAESLHLLDPRAVDHHVRGRIRDYYGDLDGAALLREITCPVLLLQSDPLANGLMPDRWVSETLSLLRDGRHALLEGIDHDLGLSTGEIGPLLGALIPFLQSL